MNAGIGSSSHSRFCARYCDQRRCSAPFADVSSIVTTRLIIAMVDKGGHDASLPDLLSHARMSWQCHRGSRDTDAVALGEENKRRAFYRPPIVSSMGTSLEKGDRSASCAQAIGDTVLFAEVDRSPRLQPLGTVVASAKCGRGELAEVPCSQGRDAIPPVLFRRTPRHLPGAKCKSTHRFILLNL